MTRWFLQPKTPKIYNELLGTKIKTILGYKGSGDRVLAMERGELEGDCAGGPQRASAPNVP